MTDPAAPEPPSPAPDRLPEPAAPASGPVVVLVRPQMGENIGAAARAMLNCGLSTLRLVAPRDGWPNPAAWPMAAGADAVLRAAKVFETTEAAIADLAHVYATTARPRGMVKPVVTARGLARDMAARPAAALARTGILFGGERSGLDNDDVMRADAVVTIPLNPAFSSLNLAQAVLVVGYDWAMAAREAAGETAGDAVGGQIAYGASQPADKAAFEGLVRHLTQALDAADFFRPPEKRDGMLRNIRNLLLRTVPSEAELRTLHGIVTALSGRRLDGRPRGGEGSQ
jgi:tRNA/rRNA methyltransferase